MKKNILKIIIITLLFIPYISQAALSVFTNDATNITETEATLWGEGGAISIYPEGCTSFSGYSSTTGLPCSNGNSTFLNPIPTITAYFRYSKLALPPIFCNDIYGSNMIATKDIDFGTSIISQPFFQRITNLTPDTDYYYCAIISNRDNIIYGGESIVKKFHTNPLKTRITTKPATHINSTSATLNGSYSSVKTVKTYFKYREDTLMTTIKDVSYFSPIKEWITKNIINVAQAQSTFPTWKIVGEKNHIKAANYSNLNGNISFSLTGLKPSTRYIFMAETDDTEATHVPGTPLSFTTAPKSGTGGGVVVVGNCYDGIKNGNETGIDVGGRCGTGNCYDNIQNGNETGIDIGGRCEGWTNLDGNCYDRVQNGNETGIDIGGRCGNWTNLDGNCYDNIQNGNETGIDIGGRCGNNNVTNICPIGWTGVYPVCIAPNYVGVCPVGWTGIYPVCTAPEGTWTWTSGNGGGSGTWTSGTGSGTWTATTGIGGTGTVTWTGTGNGTGTWTSATGSGTWTTNGNGGGIINTTPLVLGQIATPPWDAIVRYHEGIETVFTRQIMADIVFARMYGYVDGSDLQTFAWDLSHLFAKMFGYVDANGREIRVSLPDIAAYQLQLIGDKLTVYEYYDNKIVDLRNVTTDFKNASDYEYYFKK